MPEECDDMLLMEGLNRADGGESVILVCRDRIIRGYPNLKDKTKSWLFDSPELGNINNIVSATKLRGGYFGQHDRNLIYSSPLSQILAVSP